MTEQLARQLFILPDVLVAQVRISVASDVVLPAMIIIVGTKML